MSPAGFDETDLLLISALQEAPRARWVDLAGVLDIGADALAQRWERLSSDGLAWIAVDEVHPGSRSLTFALVDAVGEARTEVLGRAAAEPRVRTVHLTSGARAVCLYLETRDAAETARCVEDTIESVPGVTGLTVIPVTTAITSGADWRTRALSDQQTRELRGLGGTPGRPVRAPADPVSLALQSELSVDGRASVVALTRRLNDRHGLGTSESTVARRLQRLVDDPSTRIRCDVSPADLGWRAVTMFWLRVPTPLAAALAGNATATRRRLRTELPDVRSLMTTMGSANLHVTAWLRRVEDVPGFEAQLVEWLGAGEVVDRMLCHDNHKRMGFALQDGRRAGPQDTGSRNSSRLPNGSTA
ncbi:Lrp/AsnC family transcriptional regulator [Pseudonocardia phyllosphaerae]|uniref:Lrp/AsnC family transcriptional regulator n=1 Tax=Pseudonocardia phyllosphaerae TaxID=3390502 RepID=UPI00397C30AA